MPLVRQKNILFVVFVAYALVVAFTMYHHELWGDEIHSWNIVRSSSSFGDMISHIRYEGHPPLWHILLWLISKVFSSVLAIQILHLIIAFSLGAVVLFLSPFSFYQRILILFGYYFVYEYSVISRNYSIGIVLVFLLLWIQKKNVKYKTVLYYSCLFLIANTHLLGCLLAIAIHATIILETPSWSGKVKQLAAFAIFLPTLFLIFPPSDSEIELLRHHWELKKILAIFEVPLKSFIPFPAWWEYHFWDSNFLLAYQGISVELKQWIVVVISSIIVGVLLYVVRPNQKAFCLMVIITTLTLLANVLFPMTSMRYAGYFYISFLCALWFKYQEEKAEDNSVRKRIVLLILLLQLPRGIYAVVQDWKYTFSYSSEVKEMYERIPVKEHVLANYWALNNLSAYVGQSFYCIETKENVSFIEWNKKMKDFLKEPTPYSNGLRHYFEQNDCKEVYLFSTFTFEQLASRDSSLLKYYHVELIDSRVGAIEASGNQYVFRITPTALTLEHL